MKFVSFSGIDGAGKSTQILELAYYLRARGLRTALLTFWNDVAAFSRFRERLSEKVFKGDQGVGSPARPANRRDKNVSSPPMTALRCCLYFADCVNLRFAVQGARKSDVDVVILDRYIYDEFANLPPNGRLARAFIWLMLRLTPKPDAAFLLDADPAMALARKPEYPLEFLRRNREAYLALTRLAPEIVVIGPGSIVEMEAQIKEEVLRRISEPESGPILT